MSTSSASILGGKVDKISRYKWMSRNEPGKLQYVHKEILRVDPTYQRDLNDRKRLRIASNFNWAAFGVILVARRNDGSLWVIDGQHRLKAACSRSDIEDVPCIIFEFNGNIMDEAADFLVSNKDRQPLKGVDTFKAEVVAGDAVAIQVQELVHSVGRVIATSRTDGKTVSCVRALYSCLQRDAGALKRIWPIISEICMGANIDQRMVQGMFWLETHMIDDKDEERSITESDNRRKLIEAGAIAIMRSIGDASAYYNRGGEKVFAQGILNILNFKRRNRLRIKGEKAADPL